MGKHWHCPSVEVSAGACVWGALLLLTVPLNWVAAAVVAAVFHELCHCLAIWLMGGKIYQIRIGGGGTAIDMGALTTGNELLAALAGPFGSFLLLLFAHSFPRLALCGMVQGMFNLFPVYPMDGGRILSCGLDLVLPPGTADAVCMWVENGTIGLLLAGGGLLCFSYKMGPIPLILALGITIKAKRRKNPCKDWL